MSLQIVFSHFIQLLAGLPLTLHLVGLGLGCGFVLAAITAFVRLTNVPVLSQLAGAYVYIIRGTPLMVQMFLIYFGLGQLEIARESFAWPLLVDEFWCAILALSLNSGAYTSEVIRGSIQSIEQGQIEAAVAYGMNRRTRLLRITIPQALRQFLPNYGNELISIVKASSLASTITLMEVTGLARNLASKTYTPIETFVAAGLIYLLLNFIIAQLLGRAEQKAGDFPR